MTEQAPLPDGYDPAHVFRVVALPIERGWGVWLRGADDSIIASFGLGLSPETAFFPGVIEVLEPLLNDRFRLAYQGSGAWDQIENHWSAVVYEYASPGSGSTVH
ncbi:hypothetical protein [Gryllotalpicola protaetiae]|uniref:Uncharacterized protein n=1 Tax=Gryllotalpicola protaetiae TaxID=2419771 RepID=A0A387BNM5_9MICO|nr:hypothetical protein [Gryllotalpicola protaetiae]AYG04042.1 hypothetical protein D7I44_11225 [Gryllotalpicola protaetiae]